MNVTCPACKTRYSVDDARVPPSGVTIKCPKCSHTFVAKPPRAKGPVALPGAVAQPPAPPSAGPRTRRSESAVALPGSTGPVGPGPARGPTDVGDLDLGLDSSSVGPVPNLGPPPSGGPPPGAGLQNDVLDFIGDKASMAQMQPNTQHPEFRIRRRNGRVEGPIGLGRIQAMLRNKELQGSEDISEDGVTWRAMTSHPELNRTLNDMHAAEDPMAFGNVDLPISASTDLPIPSGLPQPRNQPGTGGFGSHAPRSGGFGTGSVGTLSPTGNLGTGSLGTGDLNSGNLGPGGSGGFAGPGGTGGLGGPGGTGSLGGPGTGSLGGPGTGSLGGPGTGSLGGPGTGSLGGPGTGSLGGPGTGSLNPASFASGNLGSGSLDFSSQDLASGDVGNVPSADLGFGGPGMPNRVSGAYSNPPGFRGDPLDSHADANMLGTPPHVRAGGSAAEQPPMEAPSRDLARELQVGDVPELPPVWQAYRNHIIGFGALVLLLLVGVYTQFFTSMGAFGIPGLLSNINEAPPPPAPKAPPPPPAKVANPQEVASLIDEHSYESFRSVFATLEANTNLADNRLSLAKAKGLASLAFGAQIFPVQGVTDAVADLNTIDLSQAMGGDAAAANLAIAKARSALQILAGETDRSANQLTALVEAHGDDKELALLLGLAHTQRKQYAPAVAALDKAIVADSRYAPALHAIGAAVEAIGGPDSARDAVVWYAKALAANPNHSRSGIEAARLYRTLHKEGHHRRTLRDTAKYVSRGLPPGQRPAILYRAAKAYDEHGRVAEVSELAQEAARLQPGNQAYVALAAVALSELGKSQEGLQMVAPVVARNPHDVDTLIARARIYVKLDDIAKGFIDLDQARKVAPRDARIPLWEARFHAQLGKFNDARKALERAVNMAGSDPGPYVAQGRLELRLGDIEVAFKSAKTAVKNAPNDARSHALLGACYARRGQLKEAEQSYERALSLDDELILARLGYANALRDQGAKEAVARRSKALAKAIPMYLQALRDQPKNPQVLFEYGRALELQGDLRAALSLYENAAALDKTDVRPHLKMVAAHLDPSNVDLKAARASLAQARKIELQGGVTLGEVRFWEARVYYATGNKNREAVAAMRSAIDAYPSNPVYQYWMGRILEQGNSLYEAITFYEKAVKLNSRFSQAILALGRTALERKLFDKARGYFDRYRKTSPDDHSVLVDIGDSYTMQNRDGEAEKIYKRALQLMPGDARALLQLGNIADRRGRSAEALRFYQRAARANPKLGEAVCKTALAKAKGRATVSTRPDLVRCAKLKSSPPDLKAMAEEILTSR